MPEPAAAMHTVTKRSPARSLIPVATIAPDAAADERVSSVAARRPRAAASEQTSREA
jgi:hypothetical protein